MWEQVIELAVNNGIWAVLFVLLLIYQLKDSKAREKKYQETIYSLNNSLTVVKDVKKDVVEIKGNVEQISVGVNNLNKKIKQVSGEINEMGKTIVFATPSDELKIPKINNQTSSAVKTDSSLIKKQVESN